MVVRSKVCKEGGRALNSVWNSLLISEVVIHEGSIILFGGTQVAISHNCCIGQALICQIHAKMVMTDLSGNDTRLHPIHGKISR